MNGEGDGKIGKVNPLALAALVAARPEAAAALLPSPKKRSATAVVL